jgi:hypothetical protein
MTLPKLLLVGAAGAYVLHRARTSTARRARRAAGTVPPPDPDDPVQELYSELDTVNETVADTGDPSSVHTSPAEDKTHLDENEAMMEGQNWFESLQTDAVEGGTEPERELDLSDDAVTRR